VVYINKVGIERKTMVLNSSFIYLFLGLLNLFWASRSFDGFGLLTMVVLLNMFINVVCLIFF